MKHEGVKVLEDGEQDVRGSGVEDTCHLLEAKTNSKEGIPYESICWREFMLAISSKIYLWRFLFWRFPSSPRVGRCPS